MLAVLCAPTIRSSCVYHSGCLATDRYQNRVQGTPRTYIYMYSLGIVDRTDQAIIHI